MTSIKKIIVLLAFILAAQAGFGQEAAAIDSIKAVLAGARTPAEKVKLLDALSRTLMSVNLRESEQYGQKLIEVAEESRDRELMVKAYMSNGTRCSYFRGMPEYTRKSIEYFRKAGDIARQNGLNDYSVASLANIASVYLSVPDKEMATDYISQAASMVSVLENDSLKAVVSLVQGDVSQERNAKIQALRAYLAALRTAEQINNPSLIRASYMKLSGFYLGIESYDKAIDYYMEAYKKLNDIKDQSVPYQRVIDINEIGNLFAAKKSYDIAISYHERSLSMADSLHFSNLKVPAYVSLLNHYIHMDQPQKALDYIKSDAGKNLGIYLANFGLSAASDQAYGVIYTELGKLDSAAIFMERVAPYFETRSGELPKMEYYIQKAHLYEKRNELPKAVNWFRQANEMGLKNGKLAVVEKTARKLDSLYNVMGEYRLSKDYNSMYYLYKDSLEKINKEKELARVEAQDEQDRQKRFEQELAEKKRRRNNIQYMAITIGIAALFVVLVLLGMFKVSATTIRMIGFFAFLMFFEFIFLIFKKNIYGITHGEPWKDLLFMIGLAALLLPLHHWMEEKVIHYLTSHNRLTSAGHHIRKKLFRRSGE